MSRTAWLLTHLAAGLAVLSWMRQYLGGTPEFITGLLPLRFLLGLPIGFIGGDFVVLLVCSVVISYGLFCIRRRENGGVRIAWDRAAASAPLLIWLLVPPWLLYVYSALGASPYLWAGSLHAVCRAGLLDSGGTRTGEAARTLGHRGRGRGGCSFGRDAP